MSLAGKPVVAFAGIGRPEKFFETLVEMGCTLVEGLPFPDHHDYGPEDVMLACEVAARHGAVPVTTMKDYVRLPHGRARHGARRSRSRSNGKTRQRSSGYWPLFESDCSGSGIGPTMS